MSVDRDDSVGGPHSFERGPLLMLLVLMLAGHTPPSVDRELMPRGWGPGRTRGKMTELLLSLPIKSPFPPVSLSHAAYWSILA